MPDPYYLLHFARDHPSLNKRRQFAFVPKPRPNVAGDVVVWLRRSRLVDPYLVGSPTFYKVKIAHLHRHRLATYAPLRFVVDDEETDRLTGEPYFLRPKLTSSVAVVVTDVPFDAYERDVLRGFAKRINVLFIFVDERNTPDQDVDVDDDDERKNASSSSTRGVSSSSYDEYRRGILKRRRLT